MATPDATPPRSKSNIERWSFSADSLSLPPHHYPSFFSALPRGTSIPNTSNPIMSARPDDLCRVPDPTEITFLRSQLDRTARESALRLELVLSECDSRIEHLSRKHEIKIRMLRLEQETKLTLVKLENDGKIETLTSELESSRCHYDATESIMRMGKENGESLEREKDVLVAARLRAQEACSERDVELSKVRDERDERIAAANSKDAVIQRLEYVLQKFSFC